MPTWFCHRKVYDSVGGFDEGGKVSELVYCYFSNIIGLCQDSTRAALWKSALKKIK